MTDFVLSELQKRYLVTERELGQWKTIRKNGMQFSIRGYETPVGNLSVVQMKAMLGLMKMDTVVFTALTKDAPLFSYDCVHAMGQDTLLLELYDTQLSPADVSALDAVKLSAGDLPDHDLGKHWYDSLKLSPSLAKRGKKLTARYKEISKAFFTAYLDLLAASADCVRSEKQAKVKAYTDGLLGNGGPSTDQFKKLIGEDATRELFSRFIFSSID